jgi:hypothetical protein
VTHTDEIELRGIFRLFEPLMGRVVVGDTRRTRQAEDRPRSAARQGSLTQDRPVATRPTAPGDWAWQPRSEDPHELRRGRRSHLGPGVCQVVLRGRVRQAQAVCGRLLRPGDKYGFDHADLTVGGATRRAPKSPCLRPHASRLTVATLPTLESKTC